MGHNIAPGLYRHFAAEKWQLLNQTENPWEQQRIEARQSINHDVALQLYGSDIDHRMIEIAKANADQAGVGESIQFKQMQINDFYPTDEYALLITNPPY